MSRKEADMGAAPRKPKRSEASIERSVCDKAYKLGVLNRKMNGLGARAWPDRLFLWRLKGLLFIEFKAPGKKATPLQENNHTMLRDLGYQVEVCDDVDEAVEIIKAAMTRAAQYE
jgi:hypothetical protein